jgi:hypothetical protein
MAAPHIMHQVTYQRTKQEMLKVWTRHTLARKAVLLGVAVVLACCVFLMFCEGFYRFLGVFFLLVTVWTPVQAVLTLSRFLTLNPELTGPTTLAYSETGVTVQAAATKTEMGWSAFSGWQETPDYFLLTRRGVRLQTIIPKRAFSSEQAESFRNCARQIGQQPDQHLQPTPR